MQISNQSHDQQFTVEKIFWHCTQSEMIERTCNYCNSKGYTRPDLSGAGFFELHKDCKPKTRRKRAENP
jgi:hypothetical protein